MVDKMILKSAAGPSLHGSIQEDVFRSRNITTGTGPGSMISEDPLHYDTFGTEAAYRALLLAPGKSR